MILVRILLTSLIFDFLFPFVVLYLILSYVLKHSVQCEAQMKCSGVKCVHGFHRNLSSSIFTDGAWHPDEALHWKQEELVAYLRNAPASLGPSVADLFQAEASDTKCIKSHFDSFPCKHLSGRGMFIASLFT